MPLKKNSRRAKTKFIAPVVGKTSGPVKCSGTNVLVPARFLGYTPEGLAIVSLGEIDNYILTFAPEDVGVPKPERLLSPKQTRKHAKALH